MGLWWFPDGFLAGSWQVLGGFLIGSWQVPLRKVFCVIVHICLRPWSATPFLATPFLATPSVQVKVWAFFIFELGRIKVNLQGKKQVPGCQEPFWLHLLVPRSVGEPSRERDLGPEEAGRSHSSWWVWSLTQLLVGVATTESPGPAFKVFGVARAGHAPSSGPCAAA